MVALVRTEQRGTIFEIILDLGGAARLTATRLTATRLLAACDPGCTRRSRLLSDYRGQIDPRK